MLKNVIYVAGILAICNALIKVGYERCNKEWEEEIHNYACHHIHETFGEFLEKEI